MGLIRIKRKRSDERATVSPSDARTEIQILRAVHRMALREARRERATKERAAQALVDWANHRLGRVHPPVAAKDEVKCVMTKIAEGLDRQAPMECARRARRAIRIIVQRKVRAGPNQGLSEAVPSLKGSNHVHECVRLACVFVAAWAVDAPGEEAVASAAVTMTTSGLVAEQGVSTRHTSAPYVHSVSYSNSSKPVLEISGSNPWPFAHRGFWGTQEHQACMAARELSRGDTLEIIAGRILSRGADGVLREAPTVAQAERWAASPDDARWLKAAVQASGAVRWTSPTRCTVTTEVRRSDSVFVLALAHVADALRGASSETESSKEAALAIMYANARTGHPSWSVAAAVAKRLQRENARATDRAERRITL